MKVLEKGKPWSVELKCTGAGNGGAGCGALLEVEAGDLYTTQSHHYDGSSESYITFTCPECKRLTDVNRQNIPSAVQNEIRRKPTTTSE
jgi:hypothetical protein